MCYFYAPVFQFVSTNTSVLTTFQEETLKLLLSTFSSITPFYYLLYKDCNKPNNRRFNYFHSFEAFIFLCC